MVRQYSEADLQAAVDELRTTKNLRGTATNHKIPRTTLRARLKGTPTKPDAHEHEQRLDSSQEYDLAAWVRTQGALGHPPTHGQIRTLATRILREKGDFLLLGTKWMVAFMRRNLILKT